MLSLAVLQVAYNLHWSSCTDLVSVQALETVIRVIHPWHANGTIYHGAAPSRPRWAMVDSQPSTLRRWYIALLLFAAIRTPFIATFPTPDIARLTFDVSQTGGISVLRVLKLSIPLVVLVYPDLNLGPAIRCMVRFGTPATRQGNEVMFSRGSFYVEILVTPARHVPT